MKYGGIMIKNLSDKIRNFFGDTEEDEIIEQEEILEEGELNSYTHFENKEPKLVKENVIRNVIVNKKNKKNNEEDSMQNVIVYRPVSFSVEEISPILDSIKDKQIVGFSLEKLKGNNHGQRIIDCISGAARVLNATLDKMSDYVYICVPENVGYEINANKENKEFSAKINQTGFYDETLDY